MVALDHVWSLWCIAVAPLLSAGGQLVTDAGKKAELLTTHLMQSSGVTVCYWTRTESLRPREVNALLTGKILILMLASILWFGSHYLTDSSVFSVALTLCPSASIIFHIISSSFCFSHCCFAFTFFFSFSTPQVFGGSWTGGL